MVVAPFIRVTTGTDEYWLEIPDYINVSCARTRISDLAWLSPDNDPFILSTIAVLNTKEFLRFCGEQMNALEKYMHIALTEAKKSLQEGNHGFGAVVVKSDTILAAAHDKDVTDQDPTAHAEMTAIRMAARKIGADLSGCLMVSTHEPCPCVQRQLHGAGITELPTGFSIADAIKNDELESILQSAKSLQESKQGAQGCMQMCFGNECAALYGEYSQRSEETEKMPRMKCSKNSMMTPERQDWIGSGSSTKALS